MVAGQKYVPVLLYEKTFQHLGDAVLCGVLSVSALLADISFCDTKHKSDDD